MIDVRSIWADRLRLAALLPLLVLAAVGRGSLDLDVENLAMKSVGTATDRAADVRTREFGDEPWLVMLATPRAPDVLSPLDDEEMAGWIDALRARDEIASIEEAPPPGPGEHCLSVAVRTDDRGRYADAVQALCTAARSSLPPTYHLDVSGQPAIEIAIATELDAERSRIVPLIIGALALMLLVVYRSPVLAGAALLAPLVAVMLVEGLQGFLGWPVDPVSALLGPCVLTVGVASSVHVLERYLRALDERSAVGEASRVAARDLRVPLLLTVATTVAGFLGLLTSPVPAVRRFGVLAACGVVLAVGTTLLCLPSLLRLLHRPVHRLRKASARLVLWHAIAARRWSGPVIAASLALAIGGIFYISDVRVDGDPLHVLSPDQTTRKETEAIARRLGANEVFELLLPPGGPASPLEVVRLVGRVSAIDGVVGPAGRPRFSPDGHALLSFLVAANGSAERERVFSQAEAIARAAGWAEASSTGLAVRIARDSSALVLGQREGILVTLLGLWAVMAIGFRSPGLALLGLIPNVLPLVIIQGALGFLGHPLSVASSMIATVMLGLVVDDTIHLLHAYRNARGAPVRRMARTFLRARRPIVITTAVLCVGFGTTLFGELFATREFGGLSLATLLIALAADLVLLPALLLWRGPAVLRTERKRTTCLEHPLTTS